MSLFPKDRDLTTAPDRVELRVSASDFRIPVSDVHIRLDAFLCHHLHWRSRSKIQSLIKDGFLFVDASTPDHPEGTGELALERRPGRRLLHGSRVVVVIPPEQRIVPVDAKPCELVVLYEDEEVLAVDKAPGVAVHPSGRYLSGTLIQAVHARYKDGGLERGRVPRLCHRLDRETSGIVLVSKNPRTHPEVMRQFEDREVEKEYLALVEGQPGAEAGCIDFPLAPSRTSRVGLKMTVAADGLESVTRWRVVERRADCALVACRPRTGRQHQIRVHLAAIGHPIVGDKLYGPDDEFFERAADGTLTPEDLAELKLPRQALHNHRLRFVSPDGGREVEVTSPLAADLRDYFDSLGSGGG